MRTSTPIKILSILLCLLFVNSIKAQTQFSVDDIYYEVISASTQQVKVIHNPNHYSGKLVIPDSVTDNGTIYSVTAIGDSAFYNCSTLNYVSIPASVDTIGNYVFYGNSALDTIEMNPTTPPNLSENSIDIESDLTDNVVLSVPCSAYDNYWLGSGNNVNYILFTNRMTHYSIVVIYDTICSNKNYTYVDPRTNETIFSLIPADYGSNDDIYENNKVSVSSGNCQVEYQLFLHINKTKRREFYYYVCDSNIVNYNANGFSFSGTAPNSVVNDSLTTCGCDSTAVLYIEMTSSLAHDVYDSVCFGSNYLKPPAYFLWNKMKSTPKGEFYNNSINEILKADTTISDNTITYKDYKQGCTSIKTNYHIKIVGDIYDTTYASICKGETYSWQYNGYSKTPNDYYSTKNQWGNYHKHISKQYDSTGFYSDTTLTSPMGCVTNKYLDLVVYPTYDTTIYDTICYNELPYTKNGFNIPTFKVQNKYYTYKDNINLHTKVNYCDSIVRLELTILPTSTTNISIDACKGGTWSMDDPYTKDNDGTTLTSGRLYYTSGTYADTLMNINGCDSIVKYKVTFNDTLNTTTHREICLSDTIMWRVRYYNPSTKSYSTTYTKYGEGNLTVGDFYETQTYTTEKGCKDIHNIHIKVYPVYDTMIYDTICYSELPYKKSGFNISKSGINNSYQTTERIQYLKTNHKCDSTVRLSLTIYPTKDIVIYDTICWGNTYDTNNFKINTDTISFTTTTKTIQKVNNNLTYLGCDSTTTLRLTILNKKYKNFTAKICYGETYNTNGFNINSLDYANKYTIIKDTNSDISILGCDSITTLTLTIAPTYDTSIFETICYGQTYKSNGFNIDTNDYKVAGYNSNYDTIHYRDTLYKTTIYGCDSIIKLDLLINPKYDTIIYRSICLDGSYKDNNFDIVGTDKGAGIFTFTTENLHTINNCDSTITLQLTINSIPYTTINENICYGEVYNEYGFTVNTNDSTKRNTSFYVRDSLKLTSTLGCDSIVRLNLRVNPTFDTTIMESICWGSLYNENNFNILTTDSVQNPTTIDSIMAIKELTTINGCDSIVKLKLYVYPTKATNFDTILLQGQTYTLNGFDLDTKNISTNTDTTIIQKVQTLSGGCDSIVTLNVHVWANDTTIFYDTLCQGESYTDNNFNENTTGTFTQDKKNIHGADSTIYLYLVVNPTFDTTITENICWGSLYNENNFNILTTDSIQNPTTIDSIMAIKELTTINGCDSIVHLKLYVYPTRATTFDTVLLQGQTYTLNGFNLDTKNISTNTDTTIIQKVQTLSGGCDSIVTLNVHIWANDTTIFYDTLCQGESYTDNNFNENTTGTFTQNKKNIHGADSTIYLHLVVNPTYDTTIEKDICWGSLYNENNFNILTTDSVQNPTTIDSIMAIKELTTINGCDSIVHLKLYVYPTKATNFDTVLLQGQTYTLNGFNLDTKNISTNTDTTIIQKVQTDAGGCDSIVTLNVHIWANDTTIFYDTLCQGESYTDNNFNENTTGTYQQDKKNIHGADSTIYLYLVVNPTFDTTITTELCYGEIYSENNFYINTTDYESILTDRNLTFKKDSITQHGCDSIIRLNLTIHPIFDTTLTQNICFGDTYQFNTHLLDNAGYYTDTLQSIYGCDSVVHLQLNVHPNYDTTIIDSICYGVSYTLNNFNVSQEGIYLQELQSIWGCDSIVHLELKVMDFNDTIKIDLCPNETYTFHNKILSETGFYRDTLQSILGCDSIINVDLTIHSTYNDTIYDTVCGNLAYTLYNFQIDTSQYVFDTLNYFSQHLQSSWGCDSSVVLALWVYPSYSIHITKEICEGGHYNDHGYELYYVTQDTTKIISAFTTKDGCDSIFILDLYVRPTHDTTIFAHICKGETYTLGGYAFNLNTSGVYKDTVTSYYGCDSIKTINLTVHDNYEISINDSICLGSEYNKDGFICTAPGIYKDTIPTYWGCDSVRTLFLWPKPSYNITFDTTICRGLDFYFGDRVLNYTGQYIDTLSTIGGCDSIVTLYLTINDPFVDSIDATICNGETYTSNGFSESEMGRYEHLFSTVGGCDSLRILNLHVKPSYNDTIEATICQGDMYTNFGFSADKNGYYTHSNQTFLGCDSITILHLQVNETKHDTIQAKICKGEIYNENNFSATESGEYVRNLQTSLGCDSIVTLLLTVNNPYIDSTEAVICYGDTYLFDDYNLTEAGRYEHLFTTTEGCDSVRILNLTVNDSYNDTIEAIICKGETYTDYGFSNDKDGYYIHSGQTYLGCDSIITLHLLTNESKHDTIRSEICQGERYSENNFSETESGEYVRSLQTYLGCDSIVYLLLTVYPSYNDTIYDTIKDGDNYQKYNFHEQLEGIYTQYLLTSQGCDSIVTLNLELDKEAKLWMANAFTPRDNNNNRYYAIPQTEDVVLVSFKIFDRQGTLLWETDDITQGWDGKYKGEFVQQGAYVYLVEYYDRNRKNKHHVVKDMFMLVH